MSARVGNPFSLYEMRRLREAVVARPFRPDPETRARVCRNLYGSASSEDSRLFAAKELAEQRERASERWGFDFLREVPRNHGPGALKFKWTRVRIGTVPSAYRMARLLPLNLEAVLETAKTTVPAAAAAHQPRLGATVESASAPVGASAETPVPLVGSPQLQDVSSPPAATPTSSGSSSPAPAPAPAPTRQATMKDYGYVCRKRALPRSKAEDRDSSRPALKRQRSEL